MLFLTLAFADPIFRINNGTNLAINKFSVCKTVINASGKDIMVPTNTSAEWSAFYNHLPSGVTTTGCGPVASLISTAYFNDSVPSHSTGMTTTTYSISTSGIVNGDLVIFVGCEDSSTGSQAFYLPTGFTQLDQHVGFGNDDQSCFAAWKIASGEPTTYSGSQNGSGGVGVSAYVLFVVKGANATTPIDVSNFSVSASGTNPATGASTGVSTTTANELLIYVAGPDWESGNQSVTFTAPTGYTALSQLTDKGNSTAFEYASIQVATAAKASTGATGAVSGTQAAGGGAFAESWVGVIAIKQ